MGALASQFTILTIVYSTVYSGADQIKHQSSALLAFVRGIHRRPVNSPHKWPVMRKILPFDDAIIFTYVCISMIHLSGSHDIIQNGWRDLAKYNGTYWIKFLVNTFCDRPATHITLKLHIPDHMWKESIGPKQSNMLKAFQWHGVLVAMQQITIKYMRGHTETCHECIISSKCSYMYPARRRQNHIDIMGQALVVLNITCTIMRDI